MDRWIDGITETGIQSEGARRLSNQCPFCKPVHSGVDSVIPARLSSIAPVAHRAICALRKLSWALVGLSFISHREGKKMHVWMDVSDRDDDDDDGVGCRRDTVQGRNDLVQASESTPHG